jgi:pyrroline-5-carboxylate reductase
MKITFIGGGNMATALIKGLLGRDGIATEVRVSDPSPEARQRLANEAGVSCFGSAAEAVPGSDVVVLAVKPQVMPRVLGELQDSLPANALVLSVAAGITIDAIRVALGDETSVVRTMPNTPALLGAGITGLFAGPGCTSAQRDMATAVMASVGDCVWVEAESLMDVVTAVSGSGPAYFYLLTEALAEAGAAQGLPPEVAMKLATATAYGAGLMSVNGEAGVGELRRRVTSPGGTTQAAIEVFQEGGFEALVHDAAEAAVRRGRELAGQESQP